MRKIYFFICLMMLPVAAIYAKETKKVAILEVVDREGQLTYSQKLMLRSNLAQAITGTSGYEAYDRTDIDQIMSEHEFQNTGMVSNDQIHQLGEMTGASYILVTEGALASEKEIYVTAKLLDVESAKVEKTENILVSSSPQEIQKGCKTLAKKMFGRVKDAEAAETALDFLFPLRTLGKDKKNK